MNSSNNNIDKYQKNAVSTIEGTLILDSHKLSYHYDRVEAWENNKDSLLVDANNLTTRLQRNQINRTGKEEISFDVLDKTFNSFQIVMIIKKEVLDANLNFLKRIIILILLNILKKQEIKRH